MIVTDDMTYALLVAFSVELELHLKELALTVAASGAEDALVALVDAGWVEETEGSYRMTQLGTYLVMQYWRGLE